VAHVIVVTSSQYEANLEGQISDKVKVKSRNRHSNTSTVGTRKRKKPSETSAKPAEKKPKIAKQSASSESVRTSTRSTVTLQYDEHRVFIVSLGTAIQMLSGFAVSNSNVGVVSE